jgi:hypothetical protein
MALTDAHRRRALQVLSEARNDLDWIEESNAREGVSGVLSQSRFFHNGEQRRNELRRIVIEASFVSDP